MSMSFQDFCVAERVRRQMTIKDFAKYVGVSHTTINSIENVETYKPTKLIMARIFEKCGYDLREIKSVIENY